MDTLLRDIRYSARKLLSTPGFSAVVIATLALAIGATTAVFSIVNSVLLKPLPFANPEGLARINSTSSQRGPSAFSYADFEDIRSQSRTMPQMASYHQDTRSLTIPGSDAVRMSTARVTANFFSVIGVPAVIGRTFAADEDRKGAPLTAVLSESVWRNRFGADRNIVGRSVTLDGKPTMVIGVAPATINVPSDVDVWVPLIPEPEQDDAAGRGYHYLRAIGRLAPGATFIAANAEVAKIADELRQRHPDSNAQRGASVVALSESVVGDVSDVLLVMFGCVGFVLLIACANVANLLLVRASTRETEIAVRTALGAGRFVLVRQLVTESLLLSSLGAVFGASLAAWVIDAVKTFGPADLPRLNEITIDARVLAFTAIVALITGVMFGLLPAWHSANSNIGQMLKDSTRGSSGRKGTQRTRNILVVVEMALAVVLLVGAGLLSRSFVRLINVDPGYRLENVSNMSVSLPTEKYQYDQAINNFVNETIDKLRQQPNVIDVGVVFGRPLSPYGMRLSFNRDDRPPAPHDKPLAADVRIASPGFFSTLNIRTVSGRTLLDTDHEKAPQVVVVSETFAKQYFPNENPLGKRISMSWSRQRSASPADTVTAGGEIVGVIADIKMRDNKSEPLASVYLSLAQMPVGELSVLVRSRAGAPPVLTAARGVIKSIDPGLAIFDEFTLETALSDSVAQPRFYALLLGAFATMAMIIAALGIYGVISYSVRQRHRELGIRIALGASKERVLKLVMGQGVAITAVGLVIGLVGAMWLTKLISSQLFGVTEFDLPTFAGVAAGMLGVAGLACYVPARRAAAVPPAVAMRLE